MGLAWVFESAERSQRFPGDRFIREFDAEFYRGATIYARPEIIFRWLCQMRLAPYGYDWIDNLGRQSPQRLIPGTEELALGQTFMYGFELIDFERNRQLTIRSKPELLLSRLLFGDIVASYVIIPRHPNRCRLLVKLIVRYPRGPMGWLMRVFLPWGDLVMMRHQLLNFKQLSESPENDA